MNSVSDRKGIFLQQTKLSNLKLWRHFEHSSKNIPVVEVALSRQDSLRNTSKFRLLLKWAFKVISICLIYNYSCVSRSVAVRCIWTTKTTKKKKQSKNIKQKVSAPLAPTDSFLAKIHSFKQIKLNRGNCYCWNHRIQMVWIFGSIVTAIDSRICKSINKPKLNVLFTFSMEKKQRTLLSNASSANGSVIWRKKNK